MSRNEAPSFSPSWRDELLDILKHTGGPGDFATGGLLADAGMPGLEVAGLGPVGLPLEARTAGELKARCVMAPFGKGARTERDETVRHTWQLEPSQFELTNPAWAATVQRAAATRCTALDISLFAEVRPQLHKLLLYEAGSHFAPHRDNEKAEGMFGTMALVLPSRYEGGALAVSHAGATREFDYSKEGAYGTHYLGFYAECKHEIRPVTSGHRLALVYNLVQTGGDAAAGTFSPAANYARLDGALSTCQML
jgi:predicted 2-oxoglutarate/Fe(II)-dependent dioxygenase YbiX